MSTTIIRTCKVISVDDDTDGKRIRVRLYPEDNHTADNELPYVFPLLPKMFQSMPKVGESVQVLLARADDGESNRYYIGPVISQPHKMLEDPHDFSARSLLKGNVIGPEAAPSTNPATEGAQPGIEDIAVIGRHAAELFLKDKEVQLRCGVHSVNGDSDLVFNRVNPAYLQMRYRTPADNGAGGTYQSQANIVADKINLLSHQSKTQFDLADKEHLVSEESMEDIIARAHALPYGDVLVEFLRLFLKCFATHTHSYPGNPPVPDDTFKQTLSYDLDSMLSQSVKIN